MDYIKNKTKINAILDGWNALLDSDNLRTLQSLKIINAFARTYLIDVSVNHKPAYERPGTDLNGLCNYNRVLLKLYQGIELFMSQRSNNWFLNGRRRLVNIKDPDIVIESSEEDLEVYVASPDYKYVCDKEWPNKDCESIMITNFKIINKFVIAVESPNLYGLLSLNQSQDAIAYRDDAK